MLQPKRTASKKKAEPKAPKRTASKKAQKEEAPVPMEEEAPVPMEEEAPEEQRAAAVLDAATIKKMKVTDLRKALAERGLDTAGKKDALVKRLTEYAGGASAAQQSDKEEKVDGPSRTASAVSVSSQEVSAPKPSPRRLKSTPVQSAAAKEKEKEKQELQPTVSEAETVYSDSPIGMVQGDMDIDGRPSMQFEGRPSMNVSPSQIGAALTTHQSAATAASGAFSTKSAGAEHHPAPSSSAEAPVSDDGRKLDALLSELDGEVESRCQLIVNNTSGRADALRTKFKTQLVKLSKKARTMPLSEFAEAYGVGVQAELMDLIRTKLVAEGWREPAVPTAGAAPLVFAPTPAQPARRRSTRSSMNGMPPPPPGALKENQGPVRAGGGTSAVPRRSTRQSVLTNQNQVPQTPMGLKTPAFDPRLPQTPACTPGGRLPRRCVHTPACLPTYLLSLYTFHTLPFICLIHSLPLLVLHSNSQYLWCG